MNDSYGWNYTLHAYIIMTEMGSVFVILRFRIEGAKSIWNESVYKVVYKI